MKNDALVYLFAYLVFCFGFAFASFQIRWCTSRDSHGHCLLQNSFSGKTVSQCDLPLPAHLWFLMGKKLQISQILGFEIFT